MIVDANKIKESHFFVNIFFIYDKVDHSIDMMHSKISKSLQIEYKNTVGRHVINFQHVIITIDSKEPPHMKENSSLI